MENLSPELNLKLYEVAAKNGADLDIKGITYEERKKHDEVRDEVPGIGEFYSWHIGEKINEMYEDNLSGYMNAYQKILMESNQSYPHAEELVHGRLAKLLIRGELIINKNGDFQQMEGTSTGERIPKGEPIKLGKSLDIINDNDRRGKSFVEQFIKSLIDRECSSVSVTYTLMRTSPERQRRTLMEKLKGLKKWNNINNLNKWLSDSEHPLHQILNIKEMSIQNPNGYQYFWNSSYSLSYKKEVLKSIIFRECEKTAIKIYREQDRNQGIKPDKYKPNPHDNTKRIIGEMEK